MEPKTDQLYDDFSKILYRIDTNGNTSVLNTLLAIPSTDNSQNVQVNSNDLAPGFSTTIMQLASTASIQQGKKEYTNVDTGFILGFDPTDGYSKFYIGNSLNYLNWDGTNLTIIGGLSVSSLNIPDTTTANSFHVDSSGNAWWGTNVATGYATAPAKILNTGAATFTNATITGALTTAAGSSISGTYVDSLSCSKLTAGSGIINSLSVLSTLTMGSAGSDGYIQSYGWNGTANGFQIKGGVTPAVSLIGGTITGGTLQTSALTNVDRIIISGASNEIQFWNSDNSISAYLFTQYSPISGMSGVSMNGGGGTFIGLGGKSNVGFSNLGVTPSADDQGYVQVTWDGNDPTSSRLELIQSYSTGVRELPIGSNLIPYGQKTLGSATYPWNTLYVANYYPTQAIIPDNSSVNLGSSSVNFQSVYVSDGLYFGSTRYMEFLSAEIKVAKPFRLKSLSSTPGTASSFTGCFYYDTTKTTLVFSDGTGWFKVVANAY